MGRLIVGAGAAAGVAAGLGHVPVAVPVVDRVSTVALSLSSSAVGWLVGALTGWGVPVGVTNVIAVILPVAIPGIAAAAALVVAEAGATLRRPLIGLSLVVAVAAFFYLPAQDAVVVAAAAAVFGAAAWLGGLVAVLLIAASAGLVAVRHLTMLFDGTYPEIQERASVLGELLGGEGTGAWRYLLVGVAALPFLWAFVRVTGMQIPEEQAPARTSAPPQPSPAGYDDSRDRDQAEQSGW